MPHEGAEQRQQQPQQQQQPDRAVAAPQAEVLWASAACLLCAGLSYHAVRGQRRPALQGPLRSTPPAPAGSVAPLVRPRRRFGRSAVVCTGKLPRSSREDNDLDIDAFHRFVAPSLRARVLVPFTAEAEGVDVFVHTWVSPGNRSATAVVSALSPLRAARFDAELSTEQLRQIMPWWSPYHLFQVSGLVSMERGVGLKARAEREGLFTYDLALLIRLDLVFFRPFAFHQLQSGPFYAAHWCVATGAEAVQLEGRVCHGLGLMGAELSGGLPDFWFLSTSPAIDRVFGGITSVAGRQPRYWPAGGNGPPTAAPPCGAGQGSVLEGCCKPSCRRPWGLHWVLVPLLDALGIRSTLRRHLWHHMDFEFLRPRALDQERVDCVNNISGRVWETDPQPSPPAGGPEASLCRPTQRYCACTEDQVQRWAVFCCSKRWCVKPTPQGSICRGSGGRRPLPPA